MFFTKKNVSELIDPARALPGRENPIVTETLHFLNKRPLKGPYPPDSQIVYFGLGCFWGAERLFWQMEGVFVTAVGYQGGYTPNPTYEEVCSGNTGHAETVLVVYQPAVVALDQLLKTFWENHDPTQGMAQGNDVGTQYRSAIYTTTPEQLGRAKLSRTGFSKALHGRVSREITTQIEPAKTFYFAEGYHQQYLAKNPGGYCGLKGTGVTCPIPKT